MFELQLECRQGCQLALMCQDFGKKVVTTRGVAKFQHPRPALASVGLPSALSCARHLAEFFQGLFT